MPLQVASEIERPCADTMLLAELDRLLITRKKSLRIDPKQAAGKLAYSYHFHLAASFKKFFIDLGNRSFHRQPGELPESLDVVLLALEREGKEPTLL